MATVISSEQVKQLREVTGAGFMDCKQALAETNGDFEQAKDLLRKKGLAAALKRATRDAKEGVVFLKAVGKQGALVELNCETDFVARTEDFQKLGEWLLSEVLSKGESVVEADASKARVQEISGKIGEKLAVRRALRIEAKSGFVGSYRHHNHKIGILLEFETSKPDFVQNEEVLKTAKDISMQVAALRPQFLKPDEINSEFLERERAIYREQVKDKPANVQDKIIQGKFEKRYEEICLLNQKSVIDNSKTISAILELLGKKLGGTISIKRFARFEIGLE
ncbi:MAG: translation elongation factor Ts [Candidatus Omnitrophica bacterium]|nr:translation elongation factor Ts [Candidatus Omnitrophota bacterium]